MTICLVTKSPLYKSGLFNCDVLFASSNRASAEKFEEFYEKYGDYDYDREWIQIEEFEVVDTFEIPIWFVRFIENKKPYAVWERHNWGYKMNTVYKFHDIKEHLVVVQADTPEAAVEVATKIRNELLLAQEEWRAKNGENCD